MKTDDVHFHAMGCHTTTTIIEGPNKHVFQGNERIPKDLEKRANQAIREGRATITFGEIK